MFQQSKTTSGSSSNPITEGVIWQQLLLFFFPILFGTFFQQLYNTADAIIVGKFVGKEALAAVGGTTGPLINLLVGFFVGLSSGASVIISQFYGAQRSEDVSRAVHTTMALALASGAALTVLGICLSKNVLIMMGTPADVLDYAVTYINIYFLGMIPSLIYNIGSGILRGRRFAAAAVLPRQRDDDQYRAGHCAGHRPESGRCGRGGGNGAQPGGQRSAGDDDALPHVAGLPLAA